MFNKESVVVHAWVRQIKKEAVKREDVPSLSNLRDVVLSILVNKEVE